jgi:hypothetical protein
MTAPSSVANGGHIYATGGELHALDGSGNDTVFSPHAIESYVAAGGTLMPDDPMPIIIHDYNPFVGVERWTYWRKKLLQPKAKDWEIIRETTPHEWHPSRGKKPDWIGHHRRNKKRTLWERIKSWFR